MFKKPAYIACVSALLFAVLLLSLPDRVGERLKLAASSLFLPLFSLVGLSNQALEKSSEALLPRRYLLEQHEKLRVENQRLAALMLRTEELERENQALREALAWRKQTGWNLRLARITGRDPANWWKMVHIDLGARHGIQANAPVLTSQGLVGRVSEVGEYQSRVVLLGDPNCRVSTFIVEAQNNTGIVAGNSGAGFEGSWVDLTYLPNDPSIKAGMRVATSGMGGVFPRGIPIGHLVEIRSVGHGLYMEAKVRLGFDLNKLSEVFVMLP